MKILLICLLSIVVLSIIALIVVYFYKNKDKNKVSKTKEKQSKPKKDKKPFLDLSIFKKKDNNKSRPKEIKKIEPKKEEVEFAPDIKIQNVRSTNSKNRTVIVYSNINEATITLLNYNEDLLVSSKEIDLTGFVIENGVIANIYGLANKIKNSIDTIDTIDILLNVDECFRNVVSLPKMNIVKANKLYEEDLKNDFASYKDKYITFKSTYKHRLGIVYYTYFIPLNIVNYFKKLATLLNAKLGNMDIFGEFLFNNVSKTIKEDYSLIYIKNHVANFVTSMNNSLVSTTSFSFKTTDEIISKYLTIVSKHEFELEKNKISNFILISDEDYDLSVITSSLNEIKCELDLTHYNVSGIRL